MNTNYIQLKIPIEIYIHHSGKMIDARQQTSKKYLHANYHDATIFCENHPKRRANIVERKNIVIRVDSELHKRLKLYVTREGTTIQEYLQKLIVADLDKKEKGVRL